MSLVNDASIVVEGNFNEFDNQELEDLLTNEKRVGPGAQVTKVILSKDSQRATVSFKDAKSKGCQWVISIIIKKLLDFMSF